MESDDDEKGHAVISYRKPSDGLEDVINTYFKQWQKNHVVYVWRMGINGCLPEFVGKLVPDDVCPVFANRQMEIIQNKIHIKKVIPIVGYAPTELLNHSKRFWWFVPFRIIMEDIASMVFVGKYGLYALIEKEGEEESRMIFPRDKVDELEFQKYLDDHVNVCRPTLHQEGGGYLTFDDFVS